MIAVMGSTPSNSENPAVTGTAAVRASAEKTMEASASPVVAKKVAGRPVSSIRFLLRLPPRGTRTLALCPPLPAAPTRPAEKA